MLDSKITGWWAKFKGSKFPNSLNSLTVFPLLSRRNQFHWICVSLSQPFHFIQGKSISFHLNKLKGIVWVSRKFQINHIHQFLEFLSWETAQDSWYRLKLDDASYINGCSLIVWSVGHRRNTNSKHSHAMSQEEIQNRIFPHIYFGYFWTQTFTLRRRVESLAKDIFGKI